MTVCIRRLKAFREKEKRRERRSFVIAATPQRFTVWQKLLHVRKIQKYLSFLGKGTHKALADKITPTLNENRSWRRYALQHLLTARGKKTK